MSALETFGSPSDWPSNFHEIKDIDGLLRCPICYEYIETAMLAPKCSHTYCSLCIKRYIGYKTQCPTCSTTVSEPELVNNRILDDVIKSFKAVRSRLLKTLLSAISSPTSTSAFSASNGSAIENSSEDDSLAVLNRRIAQTASKMSSQSARKVPAPKSNGILKFCEKKPRFQSIEIPKETYSMKKARRSMSLRDRKDVNYRVDSETETDSADKAGSTEDDDVLCIDSDEEEHQANASSERLKRVEVTRTDNSAGVETEVKDNNVKDTSRDTSGNIPLTRNPFYGKHVSNSKESEVAVVPGSSLNGDNPVPSTWQGSSTQEKVSCPVCGVSIPQRHINLHLDRCLNPERTRASATPKRKPMPKLVYHLMSDKELKKRVTEAGLSTQGDRKALVWRHREFTLLYNASCDSLNPKPVSEIVRSIQRSEKAKLSDSKKDLHQALKVTKGVSEEEVSLAQKSYVKLHKLQFAKLVEEARSRTKRSSKPEPTVEIESDSSTAEENKERSQIENALSEVDDNRNETLTNGSTCINEEKFTGRTHVRQEQRDINCGETMKRTLAEGKQKTDTGHSVSGQIVTDISASDVDAEASTSSNTKTFEPQTSTSSNTKTLGQKDIGEYVSGSVEKDIDKPSSTESIECGSAVHVLLTHEKVALSPSNSSSNDADEEILSSPLFGSDTESPNKANQPTTLGETKVPSSVLTGEDTEVLRLASDTNESTDLLEKETEQKVLESHNDLSPLEIDVQKEEDELTTLCTPLSATQSEISEMGRLTQVTRSPHSEISIRSERSETGPLNFADSPVFKKTTAQKRGRPDEVEETSSDTEETVAPKRKKSSSRRNKLKTNDDSSTPLGHSKNPAASQTSKSPSRFVEYTDVKDKLFKLVAYDTTSSDSSIDLVSRKEVERSVLSDESIVTNIVKQRRGTDEGENSSESKDSSRGRVGKEKNNNNNGSKQQVVDLESNKSVLEPSVKSEKIEKPLTRRSLKKSRNDVGSKAGSDKSVSESIAEESKRVTRRSLRTKKSCS